MLGELQTRQYTRVLMFFRLEKIIMYSLGFDTERQGSNDGVFRISTLGFFTLCIGCLFKHFLMGYDGGSQTRNDDLRGCNPGIHIRISFNVLSYDIDNRVFYTINLL